MDPKEKLKLLKLEMERFVPLLSKATEMVLDEDVTKYPIFVVHADTIEIGIPLVERGKDDDKWSINVSSLEEFVTKQLIQTSKLDDFKQVYKNPVESHCLFVLSDLGASFIFLPAVKH